MSFPLLALLLAFIHRRRCHGTIEACATRRRILLRLPCGWGGFAPSLVVDGYRTGVTALTSRRGTLARPERIDFGPQQQDQSKIIEEEQDQQRQSQRGSVVGKG